MKKLLALIIAIFFLAGCSGVQITNEDIQALAIKDTAMILGYKLAQSNPDLAKAAGPYAASMLAAAQAGKLEISVWNEAISLLTKQVNSDPLVSVLIADAISLIKINDSTVSVPVKLAYATPALTGFIAGLSLVK
jgi:uncharacterized protein YcfL